MLQAVPALIGAFVGAPVLARELETGTFRYAWTQGFGRWRWTLAKLVPLAVAVAAAAGAFSVLFSWYYQPYFAAGNQTRFLSEVSPLAAGLFDLRGVAFAAWTLAAFAIGALAGMLIRRVVPAIVATLAAYAGLALAAGMFLRQHYLTPLVTSRPNVPGSAWVIEPVVDQGRQLRVQRPASHRPPPAVVPVPTDEARARASRRRATLAQCLSQHGYTQWTSYQPASRFWPFQWIEGGWLLALSRAAHRRDRLARPPPRRLTPQGVQFSASGVSWSSWVAERASWLARNRTASAILARVGQRFGRDAGAGGPVERLDAGVDDQQRDLDAVGAELERGRVGDRSHPERSGRPQTAAGHRAPRRSAGDLHQRRCPALREREASAGGQEREGRAGRCRRPRVKAAEVGLGNRAAAEGPGAIAAVCGGGVHHEVDATVRGGRLLQHGVHARRVGDVGLERERAGGAERRPGCSATARPRRPPSRRRPASRSPRGPGCALRTRPRSAGCLVSQPIGN